MLAKLSALISIACALAFLLPIHAAQAGDPFVPSWIKNDPGAKTVTIELAADWNEHLRIAEVPSRTDVSDFNGYYGEGMTLVVPIGWSVTVELSNRSSFRHSLMLTKRYPPSEIPLRLTEQDAVWGAYTTPLDGIRPGEMVHLSFVCSGAGQLRPCLRQERAFHRGTLDRLGNKDGLDQAVAVISRDFVDYAGRP